ncbi:unnamed protein product [Amoebophrya sp. A25]|nr:unnamed protein product [Amoebophrya sp. A25]|eukprot:GSA25T00009480001.1
MSNVGGGGSYAVLKRRLAELHYTESFPQAAAPIVDHLLQDLLKSVESFHLLKQRYEETDETVRAVESRLREAEDARADAERQAREQVRTLTQRYTDSETDLQRKMVALETELRHERTLNSPSKRRNADDASTTTHLTRRIAELEAENQKLQDNLETAGGSSASNNGQYVENLKRAHNNLKHDLAAMQTRYQMAIEKEEKLQGQVDKLTDLTKEHSAVEKAVLEKHAAHKQAEVEASQAKEALRHEQLAQEKTKMELSEAREQLVTVKNQSKILELRLEAAMKSPVEDLTGDAKALELQETISRLSDEVAQSNAEKVNTRTQLALKAAEIEEKDQEIRRLRLLEHSSAMSTTSVKKQREELSGQVTELMSNLNEMATEKGSMQKYLEDRLMVIGAKDAEIQSMSFEISALKAEVESQTTTIAELKRQAALESDVRKRRDDEALVIRSAESEAKSTLATTKRTLQFSEERVARLEAESQTLKSEVDSWIEKVKETKREKADLEEKLERAMRTGMSKESDIVRLASEASKTRKEYEVENTALKIEIQRVSKRNVELTDELHAEKKSLVQRVESFNHEMTSIQQEVLTLAEQNQELASNLEAAQKGLQSKEASLQGIQRLCDELKKQKAALEQEKNALEDQAQEATTLKEQVELGRTATKLKLDNFEEERLVFVRELDRLREELKEARQVGDTKAASEQHLTAESGQYRAKVESLETQVAELQAEKTQLTGVMNSLEQTREQLVSQLQETQRVLDLERDTRARMLQNTSNNAQAAADNAAQIDSLKEALKQIDIERDKIQAQADEKSQEVRVLVLQLDEGKKIEAGLQQGIEELRRKLDISQGQLTDRERQLEDHALRQADMQQQLEQQRADIINYRRDLDTYADDLSVMTKENGALSQEIDQLHRDKELAVAERNQFQVAQQKDLQTLKITELERDDMVQLYKEMVEESQRQQAALKELRLEKDEAGKKISDYTARNKALIDAEEKALSAARQEGMNVVALKQQVSDLCGRLETLTQEAEDKLRREREFEQELFVSGQAVREVETRRFNIERDLASARANQDRQMVELTRLKNDLQQEKELTKLERSRNTKLEGLLAEFRRKDLSGGALSAGAGGDSMLAGDVSQITTGGKSVTGVVDKSSMLSNSVLGKSEELQTLYKTLDHQYALIGEMDAENVRLASEVAELKKASA